MDQMHNAIVMMLYVITAIISTGFFTYFVLQAKRAKMSKRFIVLQFLQLLWLIMKIVRMLAPNMTISWIGAVFQYASVCFLGVAYFDFAYYYCKDKELHMVFRYVIFAIAFINYMFMVTNPLHHLFFTTYSANNSDQGIMFWVHTVYSYSMLFIGYIYLFKGLYKKVLVKMGIIKYLVYLGLVSPFLINILVQLRLLPFDIDLTPIMFNMTYIIFGYVTYQYQFLDICQIARADIYAHMQEGIIVFDHNYQLESVNAIVKSVISSDIKMHENMSFAEYIDSFQGYVDHHDELKKITTDFLKNDEKQVVFEVKLFNGYEKRFYQLELYKANLNKGKIVIRVFGIDRYKKAIAKLEDQTQSLEKINRNLSEELAVRRKLVIAKERNRISREVHDILGHSLTVVISLIEASKNILYKDPAMAREKLNMALKTTRYNLNNLKKSLANPNTSDMTGEALISDIKVMARSLKEAGTTVDLITKGTDRALPNQYYDAIYHICQEGLTNAVRHGIATEITIAFRISKELVDLLIVDNGVGSTYFVKGNGLSQIEKKAEEFGGYFSCGSPGGEGFNIHVKLPLFELIEK